MCQGYAHSKLCFFDSVFGYSCTPYWKILQRGCGYIVTKVMLLMALWYSDYLVVLSQFLLCHSLLCDTVNYCSLP